MTHAYSELYIDDAMENMGCMMRYAEHNCGIDLPEFYMWFIQSGIAYQIETGNPKYLVGKSGIELANEVIYRTKGIKNEYDNVRYIERDVSYWIGWISCYYQWYRGISFETMMNYGLSVEELRKRYILHEADVSKFVDVADSIIETNMKQKSPLAYYRRMSGLTQKELSEKTGVPIRMIQLYEQQQNDIRKASVDYVIRLADGLDVSVEKLMPIRFL